MKTKQRILWRLGCVALVVYCLLIWSLEAVAAPTFTVNSSSDVVDANPGDGVCEIAPGNGVCTLRAAIMEANHTTGGGATIILPAGTYILTIPGSCCLETNGDLNITSSMTIVGAGASNTIIDGNGSVTQDRVLSIFGGFGVDISVNITGVTIRNGQNEFGGGGVLNGNSSALTISNSTISGNSAPGDCDITGAGGGITNDGFGILTIINSTVSGNSAGCQGGGIANFSFGTLTVINTTVSGNSGGGIFNLGPLTIINSTISGNSGAGISNFPGLGRGAAHVFNSTITQNSLGVFNFFASAPFTFQNTILAGNSEECRGTFTSNGFNLMQSLDPSRCTINGGGITLADPKLGSLQNNGGPTQTHALLAGSPAIDAGDPGGCRDNLGALLQTDQRGFARHVDGNHDGTVRCDIGAVEFGAGSATPIDFDGDGKSDIGVYRNGAWFILRSSDGGVTTTGFGGLAQDIPVSADYDGDGKSDQAVYRDGIWWVRQSTNGAVVAVGLGGLAQDIPVPADYDGDGKTDLAVYRDGGWFILRSSNGGITAVGFGGLPQDIPVPADYDGDGKTDFAVYRDGGWFILRSSNGGISAVGFGGLPQDMPVPADYDGDGKTDLAVYRNGAWFILRSSDGGISAVGFGGLPQDIPVPADYDGDGKTDLAVYRDGAWFILRSSDGGVTAVGFGGASDDIPLN